MCRCRCVGVGVSVSVCRCLCVEEGGGVAGIVPSYVPDLKFGAPPESTKSWTQQFIFNIFAFNLFNIGTDRSRKATKWRDSLLYGKTYLGSTTFTVLSCFWRAPPYRH